MAAQRFIKMLVELMGHMLLQSSHTLQLYLQASCTAVSTGAVHRGCQAPTCHCSETAACMVVAPEAFGRTYCAFASSSSVTNCMPLMHAWVQCMVQSLVVDYGGGKRVKCFGAL